MHGRVKVRTSAELQAINRKKEQEKAAVYELKMRNLMQKKKEGQYDEEMLSLTADILFMNPDVATVWNTRKQYLLELKTKNVADIQTLINAELKLTEAGLRINPKSYCAWYHRCWILENFASDSHWARELQICTKYLELDDRNFHCWDYRRYVVERHRAKLENELDYSLKKLMSNFSNYSAWHYRSKLIPRVYSTFERENLFENEIYQHEISLVENAVYTDPNDQSAWFYQRWLLGHISSSPRFIQAGYCQNIGKVWVVVYPRLPSVSVRGLGDSKWEFLYENKYSNLLVKNVSSNCKGSITLLNNENKVIDTINFETDSFTAKIPDFKLSLDEKEIISLQQQLKSYEKLLELEPNNKWTLLTVIIIKEKLGEIIEPKLLENLEENDPYRRNYYSDWRSRHQIEAALSSVTHWSGRFEIPNQGLTSFFHSYYFTLFQEVNLSGNPLGNNVIRKLDVLLSCKVLKLADCKLTSIDEFPCLPSLRILDLSANKIQCQNIPCGLLKCKFLESVNFLETNIFQTIITEISEKLPNVNVKL